MKTATEIKIIEHGKGRLPEKDKIDWKLKSAETSGNIQPVSTCQELQNISHDLTASYQLTQEIDCSDTKNWNSGAGFSPIGTGSAIFSGNFNGNHYAISSFFINRPSTNFVALFGRLSGFVSNVVILDATVSGHNYVASIVGSNIGGTVINSTLNGNSHISGSGNAVGGIVGQTAGVLTQCYAEGIVLGGNYVGGVTGSNYKFVANSYSNARVSGSYSIVGGLVGSNWATVYDSYSIGPVTTQGGGLIGYASPDAKTLSSYWNTQTSGKTTSAGGIGKTTAEMTQQSTYTDWNFYNIWQISGPNQYPNFRSNPITLRFSAIPSPQTVNTPFPITIETDSYLFNCDLSFHSERGEIFPLYSSMVNSVWKGMITLYEIGNDNHLALRWYTNNFGGVSVSNNFDVVKGLSEGLYNNSSLFGYIVNDSQNPIKGASVQLYPEDSKSSESFSTYSTITNAQGYYQFDNLLAEEYFLQTQKSGYQTQRTTIQTAMDRPVTGNQILSPACNSADFSGGIVPVLLLPGIMGSKSSGSIYPNLPFEVPTWNSGELDILDPFSFLGFVGWKQLRKLLVSAGYKIDCTVFDVPYDWSLSVDTIRDLYLIPWIKHVKNITGSDTVDIVAHSMGGLVTRSYIQSKQYAGDVRKFAMAGTPNKGSDNAYYLWEGGDPILADKNAGNAGWKPPWYFYTNTLSKLYNVRTGKIACSWEWFTPTECDNNAIYKLAHSIGWSVGNLMPIYDAALLNSKTHQPVNIIAGENALLKTLNGLTCLNPKGCLDHYGQFYSFNLPWLVMTRDNSKVQTMLFVGNDEETINDIDVIPQTPPYFGKFYKDGEPISLSKNKNGDGTVLNTSVIFNDYLPPGDSLPYLEKTGKHAALIGVFKEEIVSFITGDPVSDLRTSTPEVSILLIGIDGRVQPMLKGPYNTTLYDLKLESSRIQANGAASGNYMVTLDSLYQESYGISVMYLSSFNNTFEEVRLEGYFDESLQFFSLTINNGSATKPLQLSRAFEAPLNLTMYKVNNDQMLLTWKDPANAHYHDVDYYQLFWRLNYDPYFHYYSKSVATNYLTNLTWSEAIENTFVVRSMLKNGNSTFFSPGTWMNGNSAPTIDLSNLEITDPIMPESFNQKVHFYPDQNDGTGKQLLSYEPNQNIPTDPMTSSASRLQPPYSSLFMTLVWLGRSGQHVWSNFNMRFNALQIRTMEWLSQCYQYYSLASLKHWYEGTASLKNVTLNQVDKETVYSFQVSEENAYTPEGMLFSGCQVEFNNANEKPVIVRFETDASDKNQLRLPVCEIAKHQDTEQPFIYQDATIEHPCHIDNELLFVNKLENQVVAESQSCSSVPNLSQSWSSAVEQTAMYSIYATLAILCTRKTLHKIADRCSNKNVALSLKWFGDNVLPYLPLLVGLYSGGLSSRAALLAGVATSFALTRMGASKYARQLGATGVSTLTESVARYGIFGATTGYVMKQAAKKFFTTNIGLACARHVEEVVENTMNGRNFMPTAVT